jgi:hypothetical protein
VLATDQDNVYFHWKDYRDNQQKVMPLTGAEFLRRFFQHVLPKGFMRIRHYGFLSNRRRRERIGEIRRTLHVPQESGKALNQPQIEQVWLCRDCKVRAVRRVAWLRLAVVQRE